MKLDEIEKLKIINADLLFRLAEKEEQLQTSIFIATTKELDPDGRLEKIQAEIFSAQQSRLAFFEKYQQILADVNERLNINIKDYMINNETGELIKIQPPVD